MRLVLAIAVLAASAVAAHAAEDRYGPPRTASASVVTTGAYGPRAAAPSSATAPSSAYTGRLLGWSGKTVAPPPPLPEPVAPPIPQAVPQPVATAAVPARGVIPRTYPSTSRPMQTAYASPAPQAPLPTSLYDRPAAAPRAMPAPQPAPVSAPQSRPQAQAAAPLPPSPAPSAPRAPAPASSGKAGWAPPKYYSVHRQFGETPDRIEIPPPTSYWVDRAGVTPASDGAGSASAPDDYPVGGVGNEPEEERPIKERIRTTNADGTVTTTTKRAAR